MTSANRHEEIVSSIRAAYGSLEKPNYAFAEGRLKTLRGHACVRDLMSRYRVDDQTDLNDHAALHLLVRHDDGGCVVCLSLVAPWAMVFRLERESLLYERVIEASSPEILPAERDVIAQLGRHGFELLTREEAAMPIAINLFNTDREDARVYHAVVSDDSVLPRVLSEP